MPKAQLHKREFDICLLEYSTRRLCFIGASYIETSNENGDGNGNEELQRRNRFYDQNKNFPRAEQFSVHFFAAHTRPWR